MLANYLLNVKFQPTFLRKIIKRLANAIFPSSLKIIIAIIQLHRDFNGVYSASIKHLTVDS